MRKPFALILTAFLCVTTVACGQAFIPVSGAKVLDNNLQPLTGQLVFTVTNTSNVPVTYTPQGGSSSSSPITIPVSKGAVQQVGGFPATIPNPATMAPSNTRYRLQVQSVGGGITYFTFPLVNITDVFFSYDGYRVPTGITASGIGLPRIACDPAALYNNTLTSDAYPWVCSRLLSDNSLVWTQNPSLNPLCQKGNNQAIASPAQGSPYCIDSTQAFATPGFVLAGPTTGSIPGQVGLVPISQLCSGSVCGSGANPAAPAFSLQANGGSSNLIPGPLIGGVNNKDLLDPGSINSYRQDYNLTPTDFFVTRNQPWNYTYVSTNRQKALNQGIQGLTQIISVNSGMEDALLASVGNGNNNVNGIHSEIDTHGPIQIGGAQSLNITHAGMDDTVVSTRNILCAGIDRGDNEGCEEKRHFMGFLNHYFGGSIVNNGVDALGNPKLRFTNNASYDLRDSAAARILTDLSTIWSSPGNISDIATYSDARFIQLDGDGASGFDSKFGATTITTVVGGADGLQYGADNTACTSTGPEWPFDPYAGNPDGTGTLTASKCVRVASSAGFSVGQVVGFWGQSSNYEYERVQSIPDSTHIVVTLINRHEAGELVTGGGCVGWGISSTLDNLPARTLDTNAGDQPMPQHLVYPCVASIPGNHLAIWVNSFASGREMKTNAYANVAPRTPMTITPTVVGGVVTSIAFTESNYQTLTRGLGGNTSLPAPTLSYSGSSACTVNPVITLASFVVTPQLDLSFHPTLVSGGSGCPSNLTITPQATYPSPVVAYQISRGRFVTDPSSGCPPFSLPTSGCPNNGYMVADPPAVAGTFATGHIGEITPHWNQYMQSQETFSAALMTSDSNRTGPYFNSIYNGIAIAPLFNISSHQDTSVYIGRPSNNFTLPNPSLPSCTINPNVPCYSPTDGRWAPIQTIYDYYLPYQAAFRFSAPPMSQAGHNPGVPIGPIIGVYCFDSVTGGEAMQLKCDPTLPNPIYESFNMVDVNLFGSSRVMRWAVDPKTGTMDWTADKFIVHAPLTATNFTCSGTTPISGQVAVSTGPTSACTNTTPGTMWLQNANNVAITGGTATLTALNVNGRIFGNGLFALGDGLFGHQSEMTMDSNEAPAPARGSIIQAFNSLRISELANDGSGSVIVSAPTNILVDAPLTQINQTHQTGEIDLFGRTKVIGTIASGNSINTDLVGELSFSSATTATYTFTTSPAPSLHPVCTISPEATTASSGAPFVTYTGVTSFTVNFPTGYTGAVGYQCVGRN